MSDLEKMKSFGAVEEDVDDLSVFKSLLQERFNSVGVYYYYPAEKEEYDRSVIVNAKRELKIDNLLEMQEGPVTLLAVMRSIDVPEGANSEDDVKSLLHATKSYLGEGYYFIVSSTEGIKKAIKQCLPSDDRSYVVTGDEFRGKELVYYTYAGDYLFDPFNSVAFLHSAMIDAEVKAGNSNILKLDYHQPVSEIANVKEVQESL